MTRKIRIGVVLFLGASLIGQPLAFASHGSGGGRSGGGHAGGGHAGGGGGHAGGGGHVGGGRVDGGNFGGGHIGGGIPRNVHQGGPMGGMNVIRQGPQAIHGGANMGVPQGVSRPGGVIQHNPTINSHPQNSVRSSVQQHLGPQTIGSQGPGGHRIGKPTSTNHPQNIGLQHQNATSFHRNHAVQPDGGTAVHRTGMNQGVSLPRRPSQPGTPFLANHAGKNHAHHVGTNHVSNGVGTSVRTASLQSNNLSNQRFLTQHHAGHVTSVTVGHPGSLLAGHSNHLGNQGFNHHHLNGNHPQFHGNGNNGNWNHSNWNHSNWNHGNNHNNYHYNYYGGGRDGLRFGLVYGLGSGWLGYDGVYGLGYANNYYGLGSYGYGLGGYGYGFSGLRYGYGLNNSFLNYGCVSYQPCCADQSLNLGYVGIIPDATDNTVFGIGSNAIAYVPQLQLTALGIAAATDAPPPVVPSTNPPAAEFDKTSGAASGLPTAEEFAQIGEAAFKSRDYKGAVRAWKHGLVDDPQNSVLVLMLSQGLFATEQFSESAGAIQAAMQTLPQEKWDVVVKNFRDLYGKGEDYTAQVRSLEKAAREKSDDPALRFLLGYHYGFLGYPAEAVKQLEKCVKLAPQDESARKLLSVFEEKLPKPKETPGQSNPPATAAADDKSSVANPAAEDFVPPPPLSPEPSAPALGVPKSPID